MKHEIAMDLLSAAAYGTRTTTELVAASRHSPTTVMRYLGELERRGWMERRPTERMGVGRPPILRRPTDAGLEYLRAVELARFRELSADGVLVLWGPVRALAFWGVPLMASPDLFADRPIDGSPFAVVLERNPVLYEGAIERDEGRFPTLESLIAWLARSGDPRLVSAAAVLLGDPRLRVDRLLEVCDRMHSANSVGFLAVIAGRRLPLEPSTPKEVMLPTPVPVEPETRAIARRWRVENPISATIVKEMARLYGGARRTRSGSRRRVAPRRAVPSASSEPKPRHL